MSPRERNTEGNFRAEEWSRIPMPGLSLGGLADWDTVAVQNSVAQGAPVTTLGHLSPLLPQFGLPHSSF